MVNFDFITNDELRSSLESDYGELKTALEGKAYKAVHVLAGSIIEAVLVDYLLTIDYKAKSGKDPLNMTFEKLIEACKDEKIVSQRVSDLSTVIRSYRNLIHPARVVRLNERVDQNGAKVADALVEMIIDEIAFQRKKTYGYTAQQIIDKMTRDSSVQPILGNILKQTNRLELERLLDTLPSKYFELMSDPEQDEDIGYYLRSFDVCFRMAFDMVTEEIRTKVTTKYARVIRESSEREIQSYGEHFFVSKDLQYLSDDDRELVKSYILHRLSDLLYNDTKIMSGLGQFLTHREASDFTDAIIRALNARTTRTNVSSLMEAEFYRMDEKLQAVVLKRLDDWIAHYGRQGSEKLADIVSELKQKLVLDEDLPF